MRDRELRGGDALLALLGVSGADGLISTLLALSLQMLAKGERMEAQPVAVTEPDEGVTATAMQVAAAG